VVHNQRPKAIERAALRVLLQLLEKEHENN
jgi:hypothetical protein